jgi:hypothetical protein
VPEPTPATLVRAPRGFDVPFSTYLPRGLNVDFNSRGDSAAVRFTAAFGGRPVRNAYMHILMYPPGTTRLVARGDAMAFLRGGAPWRNEGQPADPPPWALEAYTYAYTGDGGAYHVGRVVLGRHGSRYFHVVTHYPAEYGDGLGPRLNRILEHWRWEDTGRMLTAP